MNKVVRCQEVWSVSPSFGQAGSRQSVGQGRAQINAGRHFQCGRANERKTQTSLPFIHKVSCNCRAPEKARVRIGVFIQCPCRQKGKQHPSAHKQARQDWDQPAWNRNVGECVFSSQWLVLPSVGVIGSPSYLTFRYVFLSCASVQLLVHSGTDGTPKCCCMCVVYVSVCVYGCVIFVFVSLSLSLLRQGISYRSLTQEVRVPVSNSAEYCLLFFFLCTAEMERRVSREWKEKRVARVSFLFFFFFFYLSDSTICHMKEKRK
jgi:hypothetical protein